MRKRIQYLILTALLLIPSSRALADEGMWMLPDLKTQNELIMKEMGLLISVDDIYNPEGIALKDAVVHFGRGCTGEVISSEGLVLTNHHCGYGSIQSQSTVEHDYLTDGFWARSLSEELPIKGLTITFINSIYDVTDYVQERLKVDDDPEGINYLSPKYLKTVAERFVQEKKPLGKHQTAELKAFYGGNKYYMFIKTTYKDIRLVGAPPSSIGKFGADTDNWMWPRHTGDFSMFRIYADRDGQPAEYSKDNQPLRVKKYLSISLGGYKPGDFTFVIGFPGRNWRYMISDEVDERVQTTNFMRHHVRDVRQNVLRSKMEKDAAVRIHYASKYASSANYWKNAIGMNEGLVKLKVDETKKAQQHALLEKGKALGTDEYQKAFHEIKDIVSHRKAFIYHQQAIYEALMNGMDFMKIPDVEPLIDALRKKDATAINKAKAALTDKVEAYFDDVAYPEVERKVCKAMMKVYAQYIPADQRISIFSLIGQKYKGSTDAFIDACIDHSIFKDRATFQKFIQNPKLKALEQDPVVQLRLSTLSEMDNIGQKLKESTNRYNAAHKTWVKGMMDMRQAEGKAIYPDANSTMRLTYGKVEPYDGVDGISYNYYTTLKGVMQKEDPDNSEFVVPARLKQLYEARDFGRYANEQGEMPACFIVCTDNTGGNSGSPCFNAKGQLIGLGFDRNYEGLTGDIAYRPDKQRAICVDIRYVLFIIDKYAGAQRLIDEMNIVE